MPLADLFKFLGDVKAEASRVTWPTWPATRQMTIMVFILVTVIALFLLGTDMLIGLVLSTILGM